MDILSKLIKLYYLRLLTHHTHHVVFYPQNGYRTVTIDSVTSFHPMYTHYTVCIPVIKLEFAT